MPAHATKPHTVKELWQNYRIALHNYTINPTVKNEQIALFAHQVWADEFLKAE